ncbi:MAG: hypothetical protein ACLTKE_07620 [Coprococcus sp.]
MLKSLNMKIFGLEHTGQLGMPYYQLIIKKKRKTFQCQSLEKRGIQIILECEFDESILKKHKNKEVFAIYERGFLGVCSTHFIRQNYTEVNFHRFWILTLWICVLQFRLN